MNSRKTAHYFFLGVLLFTIVICIESPAQSGTSGAISGTVLDASGAALPDATVTAAEIDTKATRTVRTDSNGRFLFSQVNPGTYTVTVRAAGFAEQASRPVAVEVSRTATLNFNLAVSSASQTIEVTAQQTLLTLENPNTTTTIESRTISNLPNAGSDLTFVAQFAPGALMNTAGSSNDSKAAGGYGNVEYNGLPATSNGYILDGYDTNDPWLGLNIGLSTNLVLGLDAVEQATVNTNSYSVDEGRYGASQVNYFTKSGTNNFHGDVYELWDGSLFSAEDYFLHANDTPGNITPKPRSNVNHFGFAVGGPMRRNKLFFFTAYEGVRIALPIVSQAVVPTPAYQLYVLQQLQTQQGGNFPNTVTCMPGQAPNDPLTGDCLPAQPGEVGFYDSVFKLLSDTAGTPTPVLSCPLDESGALLAGTQSPANIFNGSGCANQREESLQNSDHENLVVVKIDNTIDANNTVWYRFQSDTGLQAAWTDPINVIFNSYSPQPQYTLVAGYTHVFRPNLVNQFNPGASWYSSIFEPNNFAQVQQTFPIVLTAGSNDAPFTTIGGLDNTYPQGRKVTQWQVNDNLDWIRGKQEYRFGINTRRIDVSDYDLGEGSVPTAIYNDLAEFTYGAAYTESQTFPISYNERVAVGNLDLYAMDTYKPTSRATFIFGVRTTWNTDPVNRQHLFARPAGSFLDLSHSVKQPLNQAIQTGVQSLFPSTPVLVWQPRVSLAYQIAPETVIHLGFGVFNDIIPAQIADLAATNAPYAPTFVGGIGGQVGGLAIAPSTSNGVVANSAADAASAANRQFQTLFSTGGPPCASLAPGGHTCSLAVSLNTFPTGTLKTPYYYQYNFGIEQKLNAHGAVRIGYVGTRGLHEPFQVGLNGYQTVCAGCFAPYPYAQPLDQRFGSVNEFRTDATSNYSGLQTSLSEQLQSLTLSANYTLSHCLDEVSNGGLLPFSSQGILTPLPGELSRQYSNCDYDVRHNLSAYGIYQIPFASKHRFMRALFRDWSLSETAFLHSGLPFSVLSQPYTANGNGVFQSDGPQFARRVSGQPLYQKSAFPGVTIAGTRQWLNPNAFVSVVDPTTGACTGGDSPANCQFGDSGRNTVRGPHFTDSDIYMSRRFPMWEQTSLRFDVQMFNAFNHPNFALPSNVEAGVPGEYIPPKFGTLESTISPPTGLLGVGLGGDSSPRMIAFQARIEF